ncbi:MAG TPA: 30S ribosomal protein S16 [Pyrinomonadaceae bacterium]|jgi:small subunit ribosomal protein S16
MLAIRLMRMGAKKRPTYRVVVKEKLSKRDGAYLENLGTYNPTREPAEVKLDMERVQYWMARGAQPTDTVRQLIKGQTRAQAAASAETASA